MHVKIAKKPPQMSHFRSTWNEKQMMETLLFVNDSKRGSEIYL